MVDIAEKIDKFKENEVPSSAIIDYYYDFTWYFGNLLFPIFLFLAVIWFTSKLANNTEVIALLSSGISFSRFMRPYLISASIIALFAFFAGMFIVPKSNLRFNEFKYKYIDKKSERQTRNLFKQISPQEYIFVSSYDPIRKNARIPKRKIGSHAPKKGGKFDLLTITPNILSKKINIKPSAIPKARLTPIPPLLLNEETETAINVSTKADIGRLHRLCLTNR